MGKTKNKLNLKLTGVIVEVDGISHTFNNFEIRGWEIIGDEDSPYSDSGVDLTIKINNKDYTFAAESIYN